MMYFGFVNVAGLEDEHLPGWTSSRAQAASYALKFSGNAFLN